MVQRGRIAPPVEAARARRHPSTVSSSRSLTTRSIGAGIRRPALVRYACDRGTMWRLWLGSRNLTRSTDLDVGLLLESTTGRRKGGRRVAGIGTVGRLLAGRSGLPDLDADAIVVELEAARWLSPDGVEVTRIDVADEGTGMRQAPAQGPLDAITVVSPFLDATFLRRAGAWGDEGTRRTLVSTRQALTAAAQARSSPLHRFDRILALDAPIPPLDVADAADAASPLPSTMRILRHRRFTPSSSVSSGTARPRSLSAVPTRPRGPGRTQCRAARGTDGGSGRHRGARPSHRIGVARRVRGLKEAPPAEPGPREALELPPSAARRRVVAEARSRRPGIRRRDRRSDPAAAGRRTPAGRSPLATTDLSPWPEGATRLPLGDIPASRHTDLLRCELRAPTPPPSAGCSGRPSRRRWNSDRDAVALSSLMGFSAFQHGCASSCPATSCGTAADGGTGMTAGRRTRRSPRRPRTADLEDIVGAWGTDKARFRRADAQFDRYCDALSAQDGLLSDEELGALGELRAIWRLGPGAPAGMSATAKAFRAATVRAAVAALRREDGDAPVPDRRRGGAGQDAGRPRRRGRPVRASPSTAGRLLRDERQQGRRDQNKRDLLAFLPSDERKAALSGADRLGLIPFTKRPRAKSISMPSHRRRHSPLRAPAAARDVSSSAPSCPSCWPLCRRSTARWGRRSSSWLRQGAGRPRQDGERDDARGCRPAPAGLPQSPRGGVRAARRPGRRWSPAKGKPHALIARFRRALAEASLAANPPDLRHPR